MTLVPSQKYVDLFWSKVEKQPGDGCWLWKGSVACKGYGRTQVAPRQTELAHRVSWVIAYGPLKAGECVLHHCDVGGCVRPDHLFKGDRGDNARDMASKGRQWLQRNPRALAGDRHWKRRRPELIRTKPPRPCSNCGDLIGIKRGGRCTNCAQYFRKHAIERPASLYRRPPRKPRRPCVNCGEVSQPWGHGRCVNCYNYLRRVGVERPASLYLHQRRTSV